jgi:amino acid permease
MDSVPVLIPQNRRPSLHAGNSEQGIAMSSLSVDQDVRNRNGSTSQESFEEGAENGFHIRKEQPNSQDPDRRAKEFKARHIQMMALGIPNTTLLT